MAGIPGGDAADLCRRGPAGARLSAMSTVPRRVVTGHSPDGVSVVVSDGPVRPRD